MDPTPNNLKLSRRPEATAVPWDGEADLLELERSLDALAAADVSLEPLSEARLAALASATRPGAIAGPTLHTADDARPALRLAGGPAEQRSGTHRRLVRFAMGMTSLAACVTLAVLLWPATGSPTAGNKPSAESNGLDSAFSLADSIDEHFSLDAYDALLAEADTMDRALTSDMGVEIELPAES